MVAVEGGDFETIARTVLRQVQATCGVIHTYTAPVLPLEHLGIHAGGPGMPTLPMHRPGHACYVHIRTAAGAVAGVVQALGAMEEVSRRRGGGGRSGRGRRDPSRVGGSRSGHPGEGPSLPGVQATTTLVSVSSFGEEADEDRDEFSTWA